MDGLAPYLVEMALRLAVLAGKARARDEDARQRTTEIMRHLGYSDDDIAAALGVPTPEPGEELGRAAVQ